jgi:hypothetical protein
MSQFLIADGRPPEIKSRRSRQMPSAGSLEVWRNALTRASFHSSTLNAARPPCLPFRQVGRRLYGTFPSMGPITQRDWLSEPTLVRS